MSRHTYQLHKNGKYFKLVWRDRSNRRESMSLGRCSRKSAQQKMEAIIKRHIRDDVSITPSEQSLENWLCRYVEIKKHDLSPATLKIHRQTCNLLREYFNADTLLIDISKPEATDWRIWLKTEKSMAENTACKHSRIAKSIFNRAIDEDHLAVNPFKHLNGSEPVKREAEKGWVLLADVQAVGHARPEIRDLVLLCYFTGLRISEALMLVEFYYQPDRGKVIVHDGKGGHDRVVRLEPELARLVPTWKAIPISMRSNIHRTLRTACQKAGVEPFTFHDLRSTRDTIWHDHFPAHVCCSWMGHSEAVARKHYLSVHEDHYTPTGVDIYA